MLKFIGESPKTINIFVLPAQFADEFALPLMFLQFGAREQPRCLPRTRSASRFYAGEMRGNVFGQNATPMLRELPQRPFRPAKTLRLDFFVKAAHISFAFRPPLFEMRLKPTNSACARRRRLARRSVFSVEKQANRAPVHSQRASRLQNVVALFVYFFDLPEALLFLLLFGAALRGEKLMLMLFARPTLIRRQIVFSLAQLKFRLFANRNRNVLTGSRERRVMTMQKVFKGFAQVLQQMPAVGDVFCRRRARANGFGINRRPQSAKRS